ncbi:MAG: hypothetical protein QNL62_18995 [Gammaproteobacteria bacterium]|nr:hypothetical protein [Gammaproteobacteria bacterium]
MYKSTATIVNVLLGCTLTGSMQSAYSAEYKSTVSLITPTTQSKTISGFRGTTFVTGGADSTTHALYGISSRERSDNPCLVTTLKENINDSSDDTTPAKNLCGPNGATSSTIKADFSDSSLVGGKRVFVTGIQVCMNNNKTRVKGYRLRGKGISDTGKLVSLSDGDDCSEVFDPKKGPEPQQGSLEYRLCGGGITEPQAIRTNCDENDGWMKWAECDDNKLATAAVLHFEAGNKPRSLVGIALKCRGIKSGKSIAQ